MCSFFPGWIPAQRPAGWPWHHLSWGGGPFLWPSRSLSVHVQCSPYPKDGRYTTYWSFTPKQGLAPLCFCHDCCLNVSSGDKTWLFTLSLLCLFQSTNRRLLSGSTHISYLTFSFCTWQSFHTRCNDYQRELERFSLPKLSLLSNVF